MDSKLRICRYGAPLFPVDRVPALMYYPPIMALEIQVDHPASRTAVIAVMGALTLGTNLKTVDSTVQQLVLTGTNLLVLDLTGCPYVDSAGLGFLVFANGLSHDHGGTLRLCGVGDRIHQLLRMTKTDDLLKTDLDRRSSLGHLSLHQKDGTG